MLMWHELKIITVNKHVLCPNLVSVTHLSKIFFKVFKLVLVYSKYYVKNTLF